MNNTENNEVRQFHELTDEERELLKKQSLERAKQKGRELVNDVVCVFRPVKNCNCGCNKILGN